MKEESYLTRTDKIGNFIRENIINFVLILICVVYVFKGIIDVVESGKTIQEIIADAFIVFVVSFSIKVVLRKKGLNNGFISNIFLATCNDYGESIKEISPNIELVDYFCKDENEERLKLKQKQYLLRNAISYDEFLSHKYTIKPVKKLFTTKEEYKREIEKFNCCKKARNLNVFQYTSKLITNAYDSFSDEEGLLKATTKKYQKKSTISNFFVGILCAILFGYFTFKEGVFSWNGLIWSSLQISIYLILGLIEYLNAYEFVTKTLREKIKRIIVIIDKFKNKINYYKSLKTKEKGTINEIIKEIIKEN